LLTVVAQSPEETMELGMKLGALLGPGDFVNLNGDLGAGKTLLVKGIGISLGLTADAITSPTFTIINEYDGTIPLYHFDLYRLESELELEQVGYLDYFYGQGITAVEWGNLFVNQLPVDRIDIDLETSGAEDREITLSATGSRSSDILAQLRGAL
jgi:tRNA threonylcarbamoyladenosine biosynthesis protein TsaE